MPDDLAARARWRAEEMEAKRAAAAEGMWLNAGYDRDRGQTVIAGKHGFTVLQTYGLVDVMRGNANFVVHAANSATDQVALFRALADRVDEQERRIKELEGDTKKLADLLAEHTDWQPDLPVQKQRPTHGSCCTCQDCGFAHDECMCEHNTITEALSRKGGE